MFFLNGGIYMNKETEGEKLPRWACALPALRVEMPQEHSRPQRGRWNMVTDLFLDMVVGQLIFLAQDAGKLSSKITWSGS